MAPCLVMEMLEEGNTVNVVLHVAALLLFHFHLTCPCCMEHPCLVQPLFAEGGYLGQNDCLWCISAPDHNHHWSPMLSTISTDSS